MGTTASGYIFPDVDYTSGVRQAIEDLADSAQDVLIESGTPRFADATARDAEITAPVLGMKAVLTSDEITYRYNGSTWKAWESDWTTYTTTLANITIGTGTQAFRYRYVQGSVEVEGQISFSTGSSMGSGPTFTLPVALDSTYVNDAPIGWGKVLATANYPIQAWRSSSSTTVVALYAMNAAGTYASLTGVSATVPGTFTTGSNVYMFLRYRAA
jgi:hypothetical protein